MGRPLFVIHPLPDAMSEIWTPIDMLPDEERVQGTHDGLLLCAPELVDLDCNAHGVGLGHWQDDGLLWSATQEECDRRDPNRDYGCWLACQWSMTNDEWAHVPVTPTHFARIRGPST